MNWDKYFMSVAYFAALRSKDESTKFGAVIVTQDNSVISTGYNSFPRGLDDNVSERQERPLKYKYFCHAERGSIYNASRIGVSTNRCKMYTQGVPCTDCAIAIIQCGITDLYVHKQWEEKADELFGGWEDRLVDSMKMFSECGVTLHYFDGDVSEDHSKIQTCIRGQWFDV